MNGLCIYFSIKITLKWGYLSEYVHSTISEMTFLVHWCLFKSSASGLFTGVAFEQGKTLPTPETVPFRLTRDIVDGMGVAGVEGVFRRSCEKTMEVMRASHEELRTIVEV